MKEGVKHKDGRETDWQKVNQKRTVNTHLWDLSALSTTRFSQHNGGAMILSQVKKCLAMLENWQLLSLLLQTPPTSKPDKSPSPKISPSWSLQVNQEHPNTGTAAANSTRIIYLVAIEKKQRCVYLEEGKMNNDPSSPSSCPFSAPPNELAPGLPVPGFQNAISRILLTHMHNHVHSRTQTLLFPSSKPWIHKGESGVRERQR